MPNKLAQDLQTPKKLLCTQSASPAGELASNDLAHCNLQQQPAHVCAFTDKAVPVQELPALCWEECFVFWPSLT